MTNFTHQKTFIALALAATCGSSQASESVFDGLSRMVTDGKASLDLRYRFEYVDDDAKSDEAEASTLRSRLTLASAEVNGFSAMIEMDDVTSIGANDYNSTDNGKVEYPIVADPEGTDLNQAWLKYSIEKADGTLGRQRINHGNQRFVGGVAWRQNEQTYDGLRANLNPLEGLKLDYSYVYNINRIFGPDDTIAQPAKWEGDNHFLRADYTISEGHTISAFGYMLDIDEENGYATGKSVDNSTDTYGVEYRGKINIFNLAAAYATQSEAGDSNLDYDADYYLLEAGAKFQPVSITVGYEVLASDNGVGFKTPLATLHKFQGWTDKFLTTPGAGIEDMYLNVGGKLGPVKVAAIYHDFQAESSGPDYGTELNLVATWPVNKMFSVQLKYASFDADSDSGLTDTDKAWLSVNLKL
jgi:hypothetical protein